MKFDLEKLIIPLIIRALVYPYLIVIAVLVLPKAYMAIGKGGAFISSHVATINTPSYGNNVTINYLDQFNKQGGEVIVSYKHEFGLYRTINITEVDKLEYERIGSASPGITECNIRIVKGLDYRTYYTTLIHEYLHCFGYNHVDDPKDVMYATENGEIEDASIEKYAKELEERIGKWKSLKN